MNWCVRAPIVTKRDSRLHQPEEIALASAKQVRADSAMLRKTAQSDIAHAQGNGAHRPTEAWVAAYLEALALSGSKMESYRVAKVAPSTVMRLRERDKHFVAREESACKRALAVVESEIFRRAVYGVRRVRYGRDGKVLTKEVEYSDMLILRLAERLERGSWSRRQMVEHSGEIAYPTRAERKKALAEARLAEGRDPEIRRSLLPDHN